MFPMSGHVARHRRLLKSWSSLLVFCLLNAPHVKLQADRHTRRTVESSVDGLCQSRADSDGMSKCSVRDSGAFICLEEQSR